MKKILTVLLSVGFVMHSACVVAMEAEARDVASHPDGENQLKLERQEAARREAARRGALEGRVDSSGSGLGEQTTPSDRIEAVDDLESRDGRVDSMRGEMDLSVPAVETGPVQLPEGSHREITKLLEGESAKILRDLHEQFKELQESRTTKKSWLSSSKESTFMLDVLERVRQKGEVSAQDIADIENSVKSLVDVMKKMGDPEYARTRVSKTADFVESLKEAYGDDVGECMQGVVDSLKSGLASLHLEGQTIDHHSLRGLEKAMHELEKFTRSAQFEEIQSSRLENLADRVTLGDVASAAFEILGELLVGLFIGIGYVVAAACALGALAGIGYLVFLCPGILGAIAFMCLVAAVMSS